MCGLCGELRSDGRSADLGAIRMMKERLVRRGPDHDGCFSDGPLGFGHRRLAIIDLTEHANQPMVDQDLRLAVVFNGTIYNYPSLREELRGMGYHFFSASDTEVILKAWHAWGEQCVERLSGMFAFAVWDQRKRQLFLARDRMGIKPLYYGWGSGWFRFASSVQALLEPGDIDTTIDPEALHYQFTLHGVVPAPLTILKGVRKLPPGHCMVIDEQGNSRERRYWHLQAMRPSQPLTEGEWLERFTTSCAGR